MHPVAPSNEGQEEAAGSIQNPIGGYAGNRLFQTPGGVPFVFMDLGLESWEGALPGTELRAHRAQMAGVRYQESPIEDQRGWCIPTWECSKRVKSLKSASLKAELGGFRRR